MGVSVDVDVGVVTWNTRELTVVALRRLLRSDPGVTLRLLVRDNGSTDGTAEAIAQQVPEADLDAGQANLGFAAGMNTLIARSTAPYFLALNSDAWPEPGAIGALIAAADRHPRAAALAPRLERPDGTLEHSTHPFPSLWVAAVSGAALYPRVGRAHAHRLGLTGAFAHDAERAVDWAVGAALLLRRGALDELGGFDETFFMYAEDLEWCWRARRSGWEVWFTPTALVRHVGNASGASAYGAGRDAAWLANSYRFYRDHHGAASTAAYRALNAAGALRAAARERTHGDRAAARAWLRQVPLHLRHHG